MLKKTGMEPKGRTVNVHAGGKWLLRIFGQWIMTMPIRDCKIKCVWHPGASPLKNQKTHETEST